MKLQQKLLPAIKTERDFIVSDVLQIRLNTTDDRLTNNHENNNVEASQVTAKYLNVSSLLTENHQDNAKKQQQY